MLAMVWVIIFIGLEIFQEAALEKILAQNDLPPTLAFENYSPENLMPKGSSRNSVSTLKNLSKILIDDYIKWHRGTLDAIQTGKLDARQVKILVHWSDKGIGDRFRGLMNAYMMAVFSKRLFLIKWEEPFPLSRIFQLGKHTNFTYDVEKFGGENYQIPIKDFTWQGTAFKRFLSDIKLMMVCNWDLNSLELFILNIPELYPNLEVSKKILSLGNQRMWLAGRRDLMFKLLLNAIFVPTKEYADHVSSYLKRTITHLPTANVSIDNLKPYIGVHIRLGNSTKELDDWRFRHQLPPLETAQCLSKVLIQEAKTAQMNPPRFFLTTDAPKIRAALSSELKRLNSSAELYYGDWEVKHVKQMRDNHNDLTIYFNTFLELYMLSHSDPMVASNSAFNDLACFWGDVTRKKRFDIEHCIK